MRDQRGSVFKGRVVKAAMGLATGHRLTVLVHRRSLRAEERLQWRAAERSFLSRRVHPLASRHKIVGTPAFLLALPPLAWERVRLD